MTVVSVNVPLNDASLNCHPVVFDTFLLAQSLIYVPFQVKPDDVPFPGSTTPGWTFIYNLRQL